jgi:hypothetical protein
MMDENKSSVMWKVIIYKNTSVREAKKTDIMFTLHAISPHGIKVKILPRIE